MRTRFDQFAKQLCQGALERGGEVIVGAETTPGVQVIDLAFSPDPSRADALAFTGLFARLVALRCLLEFFHEPPSTDEVLLCQHRQLSWHLTHTRDLRNAGEPVPAPTSMWLLSAGRPSKAIEELAFTTAPEVCEGVYRIGEGQRLWLLVINELPEVPDTLFLRLIGAGAVLKRALRELASLPEGSPLHTLAWPVITCLRLEVPGDLSRRTKEEEEFLTMTLQVYEDFVKKTRAEGLEQGREQGLEQGRVAEAKRALRRVLSKRGLSVSAEQEAKIEASNDIERLEQWHDVAITASSADEVFATPG